METEDFNEMVDRLAGYALTELVSGRTTWRTIIHRVCSDADRAGYARAKAEKVPA